MKLSFYELTGDVLREIPTFMEKLEECSRHITYNFSWYNFVGYDVDCRRVGKGREYNFIAEILVFELVVLELAEI